MLQKIYQMLIKHNIEAELYVKKKVTKVVKNLF